MNMRYLITLCIPFSLQVAAIDLNDAFKAEYIPKHWKLVSHTEGDLNNDKKIDLVLTLIADRLRNYVPHPEHQGRTLNLNPRAILILFKQDKGYQKALMAERFLPTKDDPDNTCLQDPLDEDAIKIKNNILHIRLNYWLSCGSYAVNNDEFNFRYQNGGFRLIGKESRSFMRNSGDITEASTNYLSGMRKTVTGLNEFENSDPKTTWEKLGHLENFYLHTMNSNSCFLATKPPKWCN
ncbi:hypothetical protein [Chitinimonas taiwanensis]|uniref:Uncharacterized protein n=1 Tax=Chitinimonas taiwanensis DSM 18899 TaxID=1121279 RepID=A0A1K2H695_9NEIS|nr:hypothetical protein [Chitinimonas taiwanensis]SFZ71011.1 hypothetical protein SAMN02745887_00378 [Chitinimonas taiwanensis DSM 18899]